MLDTGRKHVTKSVLFTWMTIDACDTTGDGLYDVEI